MRAAEIARASPESAATTRGVRSRCRVSITMPNARPGLRPSTDSFDSGHTGRDVADENGPGSAATESEAQIQTPTHQQEIER